MRRPDNEDFLQYIWKYQKFDHRNLKTLQGMPLMIIHPGLLNNDSGPDFKDARIQWDHSTEAGAVEIHIRSSEWFDHRHHYDPVYDSVILHVVWENNREVKRMDGSTIPVLELAGRVDEKIIERYHGLNRSFQRPCKGQVENIPIEIVKKQIEASAIERMNNKTNEVLDMLSIANNSWQVVAYRHLLISLGMNKNQDLFAILGRLIPWKEWVRLSLFQKEAMLFGVAGLLQEGTDIYRNNLLKEYRFQKYKWKVSSTLQEHQWKFSKIRPPSFPTLRLAQFAAIIHHNPALLQYITSANKLSEIDQLLQQAPSAYWQNHYRFGKERNKHSGYIGAESRNRLIINFIAPLLFAYGEFNGREKLKERAIQWLQQIAAEKNSLTRSWGNSENYYPENSLESQGLIGLFKLYCQHNRCLDCSIGTKLISA